MAKVHIAYGRLKTEFRRWKMNNALISAREDEFMEGSRLSLCTASELFCLFFAYPSMTKNLGGQAIQSREVIGNFLNSALMFVSCWIVC